MNGSTEARFNTDFILSDYPHFAQAIVELEILEGDFSKSTLIPGDRGGWTQGGISARAYPHLAARIKAGELTRTEIWSFYFNDYYSRISHWKELQFDSPWLLKMLFFGKVHGVGINHYTTIAQNSLSEMGVINKSDIDGKWGPVTAKAILALGNRRKAKLAEAFMTAKSALGHRRADSVGIEDKRQSIINRVNREYTYALIPAKFDSKHDDLVVSDALLALSSSNSVDVLKRQSINGEYFKVNENLTIILT